MQKITLISLLFVFSFPVFAKRAAPKWIQKYENNDWFEREPYIAHFQFNREDFALVGIHVKPNKAFEELDRMDEVYRHARETFNERDMLLLGDFNAGCYYLDPFQESHLDMYQDTRFEWLIDYYADTNVAETQCAYDRIVKTGRLSTHMGRVHRKGIVKGISDHYLVYTRIYSGKSSIKVAAWNVQRLGVKKARDKAKMRKIASIVEKYDIILIQEILGSSDYPMERLMDLLPPFYRIAQSPAIGRTSYKERYAYIYDTRKVSLKNSYVFPD